MPYYLSVSGYHGGQEFPTLPEAGAAFRALKAEELRKCRSRYGKAYYHAASRGAGSVTLGPDPRSALWLSFAIVKV